MSVYRRCIAAVAVRTGATLVHRDRDFDVLAAALPDLRVRSLV
jgi:predicted nucleic acid-binding protein